MSKQSIVLFAGCLVIASGSLVLARKCFPTEKPKRIEQEYEITYMKPMKIINEDGSVNYYAPEGYTLIYTEDGVICEKEISKTK